MWAFMTTGTASFLKQIADKNKMIPFSFMVHNGNTLAYYESEKKKSLFVSGKTYEILFRYKSLMHKGYVVIDHIPVVEDSVDIFEEHVKQFLPTLKDAYGIQTIRFMKEIKNNQFIILTQWKSKEAYDIYVNTSMYTSYKKATETRNPAYFAHRPFTSTYIMLEDEKDQF